MKTKTGKGLAEYVITLLGCAYAYGVQGVKLTEKLLQQKADQYPWVYTPEYIQRTRKKSLGKIAFDCTTAADLYTGTDRSANGWFQAATEKGPISTMPEIIGLMLHMDGHMGIYIGKGEVIEARGVDYGVVKTKLSERSWEHWAKLPGIDYSVPKPKCPYAEPFLIFPYRLKIRGNAARWFQWHLKKAGYDCGINKNLADIHGTDGCGYEKTWNAIVNIQLKYDLGVGAAGYKTRQAIKKAAGL